MFLFLISASDVDKGTGRHQWEETIRLGTRPKDEQNGRDGLCRNLAPAARQLAFAAGSTADPPQKAYRILLFRPGITGLFITVFC